MIESHEFSPLCQDYPKIIRNPMDFSLVKTKLKQKQYTSINECIDDVNRVFCNCYLFNQPGEDVIFMALKLDHFFKEKIKHMSPESYAVSICSQVSTPMSLHSNHVKNKELMDNSSMNSSILGKRKLEEEVPEKLPTKLARIDSGKSNREEPISIYANSNDMSKCLTIIKELMSTRYRVSTFVLLTVTDDNTSCFG